MKGNVIFSSNDGGFMFSLLSMARQYCQVWTNMMPDTLMKVLWGDYYFDKESRRFRREPTAGSTKRAFVEFILEPMYKLIVHSISNEKDKLQPILSKLGVYLKNEDFRLSTRQLMKKACRLFFGTSTCFTDMVVEHLPSPAAAASEHVSKYYQGDRTTQVFKNMSSLSKDGPPVVQILKMYNKPDCLTFDCLGRVMSGTLKRGTRVKILGEKYSLEDEEDMTVKNITGLYIFNSRFTIPIKEAHPGNWVLLEGIDQSILKTATVIAEDYDSEKLEIFRPIKFDAEPFFKLAIEPLIPSDLPKMLDGLRKVAKSYPNLKTKIEESGEHMIIGSGELYMDSVMHDLRLMYSEVEIKISDPSVTFCETVIDTSSINCTSKTPNNANKLTFIAEALDKGLGVDIELEHIDLSWPKAQVSNFFSKKYKYDILAAQSVWAFGPDTFGPNLFIDDTLPGETDKDALYEIKESLIQGFQWACREGPLCEEPMRNVKFKIIEAEVAREPLFKIPGQIIPTARRTCYSSFLMANPKILEPQILTEIQCAGDSLPAVYNVLNRRRGHLIKEQAKPGSPLFSVRASLPALDSFGFETDLRSHTVGQAFCLQVFDTWTVLPGDPLDKTIKLTILEPSAPSALAREVLVKTRKRKGLNEEVSILNYFDDPAIIETLRTNDDWKKII